MQEIGREPTIGEWSRAVGMEQNAFELRIKEGRLSKDKMVNWNLRLVVSIAKNYQGRGMTLQDLIQVCNKSWLHWLFMKMLYSLCFYQGHSYYSVI